MAGMVRAIRSVRAEVNVETHATECGGDATKVNSMWDACNWSSIMQGKYLRVEKDPESLGRKRGSLKKPNPNFSYRSHIS